MGAGALCAESATCALGAVRIRLADLEEFGSLMLSVDSVLGR